MAAVITGPDEIAVNRTLVLNALDSITETGAVTYRWYRDELQTPISYSDEALFTPTDPGTYIFRLQIEQRIGRKTVRSEARKVIVAYRRKIVLLTDGSVPEEKLIAHTNAAQQAGVFLYVLKPADSKLPVPSDDALSQAPSLQFQKLEGAEAIVLWVQDPVAGMQALMKSARDHAGVTSFAKQSVVLITDGSLSTLARAVRGPFLVIHPSLLTLTRRVALDSLFQTETMAAFQEQLQRRDIEAITLDETSLSLRPWNALSLLVTYMLTHGVSSRTVMFLLMLPFIATFLAFLKQVIGVTMSGLYTPSIIALSLLALGWSIGIVLLAFIIASGYMTRKVMRRFRILHFPKIAVILTVVSITLLLVLALGASVNVILAPDTIFVLLIMSTLAESFVSIETEQGKAHALYAILETVLAALLCVLIVQWQAFQAFVLAYPESVFLTFLVNVAVGRYSGLRLSEYVRFRELIAHIQE